MSTSPVFSVIIPTFNRAERLWIALKSLEKQSFKDFEVIVCDDGSNDNTKEIADSFRKKLNLTYLNEENSGGPARPRNNGLKIAKGGWICFLDSDDYWYSEKLDICWIHTELSDFIYHDMDISGENIPENQRHFICRKISNINTFSDLLQNWNTMANSGVMVRKSIISLAGYFDENKSVHGIEDFDMWLRIAKITNRFTYIHMSLGCYYLSPDSFSKNQANCIERDFLLLNKYRNELSVRQYLDVKAVVNIQAGLRYLEKHDRRTANRFFRKAIFNKSRSFLKLKAIAFMISGNSTFRLLKFYLGLKSLLTK
jgi:glycosyltransferase involved in cell wall biosynthesis